MKLKWNNSMDAKPMTFLAWLDLVKRMNRQQFDLIPEKEKQNLRDRYTRYLMGWENLANIEVGKEFYLHEEGK